MFGSEKKRAEQAAQARVADANLTLAYNAEQWRKTPVGREAARLECRDEVALEVLFKNSPS